MQFTKEAAKNVCQRHMHLMRLLMTSLLSFLPEKTQAVIAMTGNTLIYKDTEKNESGILSLFTSQRV